MAQKGKQKKNCFVWQKGKKVGKMLTHAFCC